MTDEEIRREAAVKRWSSFMREKLIEHQGKGSWSELSSGQLFQMMRQEIDELTASTTVEEAQREAADVANYAFMLAEGLFRKERSMDNTKPNYVFPAALVRVIDGDTYDLRVDCGFSTFRRVTARLADVNSPETSQPGGPIATAYARLWFDSNPTFFVCTRKSKGGQDHRSFVRYVADIFTANGHNLADDLVGAGHANRV